MELPTWCLTELKMENRIVIQADEQDVSTLGNLVLEAILPGGRIVRTKPTGETFTWNAGTKDLVTESPRRKLKQGRSLTTLLSFD